MRDEAPLALEFMLDLVPILLAEDNRDDIFLMRQGFARAGIHNPLAVVTNGRDAVDYLAGKGAYADRDKYPVPGLMLLDLKMPWMDGFDVLSWVRRQPEYRALPVVVLTSSRLQSDVERSRLLGVFDYRVKPNDLAELVSLLADIRKRWLDEGSNEIVEVPGASNRQPPAESNELHDPPAV